MVFQFFSISTLEKSLAPEARLHAGVIEDEMLRLQSLQCRPLRHLRVRRAARRGATRPFHPPHPGGLSMHLLICANAGPPAFQATKVATPFTPCRIASPPTESPTPTHAGG